MVTVNGEVRDFREGESVLALVSATFDRQLGQDGRPLDGGRLGVAVAIGDAIVPRGSWAVTLLEDGMSLELVTAVQGG